MRFRGHSMFLSVLPAIILENRGMNYQTRIDNYYFPSSKHMEIMNEATKVAEQE